ncbi:MAG: RodZ domain-containing protein [Parcubacteria group bacterium]
MANGFTKKSVGTLTLGEKLKKLRSDKRTSIAEASRFTKIQPAYLEYLEEGVWDKLPADVYVKGFLRSYADFLGVDEKILIRIYEREKEVRANLKKNRKEDLQKEKPINISPFIFTPKKILISAITVLVFAGLFLLYNEINSFANAPSLVILNPQDKSQMDGNSVYIEGVTDKEALLYINNQPILVGDDGRFKENLTLQSGLNTIDVKSINKFKKETTQSLSIRSNYKEQEESNVSPAEENIAPNLPEKKIKIEVRVDPGPVWVNVEADGEIVFDGTMLSGAVQNFSANDKIVINSGKGKATFVKFNDQDLGALSSDSGAVKGVTFTLNTQVKGVSTKAKK